MRIIKRREMKGIPNIIAGISFGNVDDSYGAPLHRRLGIETYVHLQAILTDPNGRRGNSRENTNDHLYRVKVTLPRIIA